MKKERSYGTSEIITGFNGIWVLVKASDDKINQPSLSYAVFFTFDKKR